MFHPHRLPDTRRGGERPIGGYGVVECGYAGDGYRSARPLRTSTPGE